MSEILLPEKSHMLEQWHMFTGPFFSELDSLVFLRDVVIAVVAMSLKFEVGRLKNEILEERSPKYALRSDLKRN